MGDRDEQAAMVSFEPGSAGASLEFVARAIAAVEG
jgi:hypothetical protein